MGKRFPTRTGSIVAALMTWTVTVYAPRAAGGPGDGNGGSAALSAEGAFSVLRCWQDGRMILEEKNWRPSPQTLGALPGPVFRSLDGPFDTLGLAGFGDTFCYYKAAKEPW